jgi:hypothetical protein
MECISLLTAVRGSLFSNLSQRLVYLAKIFRGISVVLSQNTGKIHVFFNLIHENS